MTAETTPCRLYLISPSVFELDAFAGELAKALSGGDVASFQLRMKEADDVDLSKATEVLMPICLYPQQEVYTYQIYQADLLDYHQR